MVLIEVQSDIYPTIIHWGIVWVDGCAVLGVAYQGLASTQSYMEAAYVKSYIIKIMKS